MIVALSDKFLDRVQFEHERAKYYWDRTLCGLTVRVGKRTKTFYLQTTCNGRQIKHTIGRYPVVTVDDAREEAIRLLRDIRKGIPPVKPREQYKAIPTLSEALEHYLQAKQLKPKTVSSYRTIIRIHFREYADKAISVIGEQHFAQHWETLLKTLGASVANTCRAVMNALISYVGVVFGLPITNHVRRLATAGLKPSKVKSRETLVEDKNQPKWYAAVVSTPEQYSVYLLMLALTGMRLREALNAQWEDIDLENRTLHVRETKNGKPYTIPIGHRLSALLTSYKRSKQDDGGQAQGKLFDAVSENHAASIAIRRGAPKFNVHDLRRGFITTSTKLELPDRVVKRLVNHSHKDVTGKHYVVLSVEDVRPAMQQIEDRFTELWGKVTTTGNYADDFNERELKSGNPGKSKTSPAQHAVSDCSLIPPTWNR